MTGFVFWLMIAKLAGAEVVGIASAVVSSSSIAVTSVSAGLGIAAMRDCGEREQGFSLLNGFGIDEGELRQLSWRLH